jgi:hypothetical protein
MGQNPKTQKPQQMLGFATLCRSARQAQKWRRGELNPYAPPLSFQKRGFPNVLVRPLVRIV